MRIFFFAAAAIAFAVWFVYNTGYYNGKTDAFIEMKYLFNLHSDGE